MKVNYRIRQALNSVTCFVCGGAMGGWVAKTEPDFWWHMAIVGGILALISATVNELKKRGKI